MSYCKRCWRKLTNIDSIEIGYGPICFIKTFKKTPNKKKEKTLKTEIKPTNMVNLNEWFK